MSFYIFLFVAIVLSLYIWQRERSKLSFYNLVFCAVVILFAAGQDFVKYTWHLTGTALFVSDTINVVSWAAAVIIWIVITIKFVRRK
jgi:hypothetical protein